jgi:Leucine-rich repeat (LRR) protein
MCSSQIQIRLLLLIGFALATVSCAAKHFSGGVLTSTGVNLLGYSTKTPLAYVNLRLRSLTSIASDAFDGFRELSRLDLSSNEIASFKPGVFHELVNMEILDLSHNKLSSLNPSIFSGLKRLAYLLLESNRIISVDSHTFVGLRGLLQVCMAQNPASSFHSSNLNGFCRSNSGCELSLTHSCYDHRTIPILSHSVDRKLTTHKSSDTQALIRTKSGPRALSTSTNSSFVTATISNLRPSVSPYCMCETTGWF